MNSDQREILKSELNRVRRVSDQLISMHSILRDEFSTKSTIVDCTLFGSSVFMTALVFVDPLIIDLLPISPAFSRLLLGFFSLLSFFLSLIIFRIDWKSKSDLHKYAAEAYANIKLDCQALLTLFDSTGESEIQKLLVRYNDLGRICIVIPETDFLRLKNEHTTKVALSKYLDDNPGACLWLIRWKIWVINTFGKPEQNPLKRYL